MSAAGKELLKSVKAKTPQDLVVKTVKTLSAGKKKEEAGKLLAALKDLLYGPVGAAEQAQAELVSLVANEAYERDLLYILVTKISTLDFEAKKDCVAIFTKLMRREYGTRAPTAEHVSTRVEILEVLVHGYDDGNTQVDALNSGIMLRECIKQQALAKIILNDAKLFDPFFDYVQKPTFDIAADAFSSFKELLSGHKILCATFLEEKYDTVFEKYEGLLMSANYVTKRQSLKLLGELLLDRANFSIMTKFIGDHKNLKIMMNMLRDPSKNIQFEAFHVFKVFVANPNKSATIMGILLKNKEALVGFLKGFQKGREEDEQFAEEKSYLIKQIEELK